MENGVKNRQVWAWRLYSAQKKSKKTVL